MALDNTGIASAVAAERDAEGVLDNLNLELRRGLWRCANDAAVRLARASGVYEYGQAQQALTDFVNGAIRCAVSVAADPTSDDLERLAIANIGVNESGLSSSEVSAGMGRARGYFKMSTRVPAFDAFRANANLVNDTFDHYTGLMRRPLLAAMNDAAVRLDTSLGYPPFVDLDKSVQCFFAAAIELAVLATDDPTSADSERLTLAGL